MGRNVLNKEVEIIREEFIIMSLMYLLLPLALQPFVDLAFLRQFTLV
jgi:hypothetical protein